MQIAEKKLLYPWFFTHPLLQIFKKNFSSIFPQEAQEVTLSSTEINIVWKKKTLNKYEIWSKIKRYTSWTEPKQWTNSFYQVGCDPPNQKGWQPLNGVSDSVA